MTYRPRLKPSLALLPALLLLLAAFPFDRALAQTNLLDPIRFQNGTNRIHNTGGTTHTIAFNVSGSNTLLVVGWAHDNNASVTSVTYGGVPMISIADQSVTQIPGGPVLRTGMFYLLSPAAGTHDLVATRNQPGATMDLTVALYTGVRQSGQPDAVSFGSVGGTSTPSTSLTTVSFGCWIIGSTYSDGPLSSSIKTNTYAGTNTFLRAQSPDQNNLFDSNGPVPVGSNSLTWTLTNALRSGWVFASFAPAAQLVLIQPQNQIVPVGSTAVFAVVTNGQPSVSFQWFFNQTGLLPGQTNSTLVLTNVGGSQSGAYSVVVSSPSGSVQSSDAFLTVLDINDNDRDGIPNFWESLYGLNPNNPADANTKPPNDRLTYLQKYLYGLNPTTPDTDLDGLSDYDELFLYGTDPLKADTDGDGMPDGWEVANGLNPRVNDANGDLDLDGLTNLQEYNLWLTNPLQRPDRMDSLGDGRGDYERATGGQTNRFYYDRNDRFIGVEYSSGRSIAYTYDGNNNLTRQTVLSRASETNGLPVLWRFLNGLTNNSSVFADTDGEGWTDYQEWKAGTNPRDATSKPGLNGNPGLNIASLRVPFTPSNFVVGVGQIDGIGAEEIVIGADGNPGTNTNFMLVLTQGPTSWTTQRVDVGPFGITSIAVGQPTNRPSAGIYVGLRGTTNGSGRVMEFTRNTGVWQSNVVAFSTNEAAFVLGVRGGNDLLATFAATNAADRRQYGLTYLANAWTAQPIGTNTSNRGLGTIADVEGNQDGLRLVDSRGIELLRSEALPTNAVYWPPSGKQYFPITSGMTWSNAQAYAQQFGGNLVTIESLAENAFVASLLPGSPIAWIGLYREAGSNKDDANSWKWASGSTSSYRNWREGEPNSPNTELWVYLSPFQTWYDASNAGLQLGVGEVTVPNLVLPEPAAAKRLIWRGSSLAAGSLRGTNGSSVFYSFDDDKNANGLIDSADDFVTAEYLVNGTNASLLTLSRQPIDSLMAAQSYGLASVNFLGTSNEVFFTGEPDGKVFAWTATGATNPLQRQLFSSDHAGKAWHALAAVKTLELGEGLIGLRVDPAAPKTCDVILWPPQSQLLQPAGLPQTAPIAAILPSATPLGNLPTLTNRLWDAEGNASTPYLQFQFVGATNWQDATIVALDGVPYTLGTRVAALPGGVNHILVWDAATDLGPGKSTNILLRARAADMTSVGAWSVGTPFQIETSFNPDSDNDGLPDAWEIKEFTNLNQLGTGDPDGDGFNNFAEFVAGTNPNSATSNLALSIRLEGGQIRLYWNAPPMLPDPALRYYLERRTNLLPTSLWEIRQTNPPSGILLPVEPGETYFRLRLGN